MLCWQLEGYCLQDRQTQTSTQTPRFAYIQMSRQSDRQTVMTNAGAGKFMLEFSARHLRDKSMTKAD